MVSDQKQAVAVDAAFALSFGRQEEQWEEMFMCCEK
jgi:hypothetical protein